MKVVHTDHGGCNLFLHSPLIQSCCGSDFFVYNNLSLFIEMYTDFGNTEDAWSEFNMMPDGLQHVIC